MAQEPKKRHSRARQGKRRAAITLTAPQAVLCKNCGASHISHTICANCGFYKGVQFIQPKKSSRSTQPSA